MPCDELDGLRAEATHIKELMEEQRYKVRATAQESRRERPAVSELLSFLERKLQRLAEKIERHVAEHRCQQ